MNLGQYQSQKTLSFALTIKKEASSLTVRCNTLEKCKRVTDTVRCGRRELRRVEQRIHGDDFLKQ